MNRRFPFACGQSGRLVAPPHRPEARYATWDNASLHAAGRQAVSPATSEPEPREFYTGWDDREYEVQR